MTLTELQARLRLWQGHNFPNRESWEPLMGIGEEIGELMHSHLKEHQGIRLEENHPMKAKDALGDILIYAADYANARGFNLQQILDKTWEEVSQRDWQKHREEHNDRNI